MPQCLGFEIIGCSRLLPQCRATAMFGVTARHAGLLLAATRGWAACLAMALLWLFSSGCRTVNNIRKTCYLPPTDTFSLGLIGTMEDFRARNGDCLDVHTLRHADDRPELPRLIARCNLPEMEKVVAWLCPAATPTTGNCVLFTNVGVHVVNTRPDDIAGRQFLEYDELLAAALEPDCFRPYLLYLTTAARKVAVNTFDYRLHDNRQFFATLQSYLESPDVPQGVGEPMQVAGSPSGVPPVAGLLADKATVPPTAVVTTGGNRLLPAAPRAWWNRAMRAVGARGSGRRFQTPEETRQSCYLLPTDVFSLGLIQLLESFKARNPTCADLHTLRRAQGRVELPTLVARARLAATEKVLAWVCAEPFTSVPCCLLFTTAGIHVLNSENREAPGNTFLSHGYIMAATLARDDGNANRLCLTVGGRRTVIPADAWRLPEVESLFDTLRAYLDSPATGGTQAVLLESHTNDPTQPAASVTGDPLGTSRMRRPPPAEPPTDFTGTHEAALRKFQLHVAWVWHAVDQQLQTVVAGTADKNPGLQLRQVQVFLDSQLAALAEHAGSARVRHAFSARLHQREEDARQAETRWNDSPEGTGKQAAATLLADHRQLAVRFARTESDLAALATALRQLADDVRTAEQRYWDSETTGGKETAQQQALVEVRQLQTAWWQAYMR